MELVGGNGGSAQASTSPKTSAKTNVAAARGAAGREQLLALLAELGIQPPDQMDTHLVSAWSGKHVFRIDAGGTPWAYVRCLPGRAADMPRRWLHLRLSTVLADIRVGPPVLGISPESAALGARAAIVEAALEPTGRDGLRAREAEAIGLFARLHECEAVRAELQAFEGGHPSRGAALLESLIIQTREKWADAVSTLASSGRTGGTGGTGGAATGLGEAAAVLLQAVSAAEHSPDPADLLRVPAHGDPNHSNFGLGPEGELRMLDFEDLSLTHPVADLGPFLTWYVPAESHRKLLEAYPLADPDALASLMRLWVPVRYLRIAAHWLGRYGEDDSPAVRRHALDALDEWMSGASRMLPGALQPCVLEERLGMMREQH